MQLGMLGRDPAVMDRALATAARLGHPARGTLDDAEAVAWVQQRAIEGLVLGGGVEPASRQALLAACSEHGVRAIEVFGPGNLERALASL